MHGRMRGSSLGRAGVLLLISKQGGRWHLGLGSSELASRNLEFGPDQIPQHLSKPSFAVLAPVPEAGLPLPSPPPRYRPKPFPYEVKEF